MKFSAPLQPAILLRRYKRFLADVQFPDGTETTVHCPNPGAMLGVAPTGARCWLSLSSNKNRKLPYTLEIVECPGPDGPTLVGINTNLPNRLAEEAISAGLIGELDAAAPLRREVRYGEEKSRIDILLETSPPTWVEVKNCHLLRRDDGITEFPDCVTTRGAKHLRELSSRVAAGDRAVLLFIVQRTDATGFSAAADLDPAYAAGLTEAMEQGVEVLAYDCDISPEEITVRGPIPVIV
ncbi:DNA/RNA nuclease SfsA [Parvularcula sp. LCG005]|uniref:DNA/RNA nuclease SfsA n=1 Tax=Parvularcula sp. LCG005 TaxID=3078805 RepID=UPI002943ACCC|nr:DNA/RNA nuclease SfsA [Parvularcula sp. LCG005]WOI54511.1 DNA/RNA nuclease SfsA [Parvularcula sp. LCG005]